MRLCAIEADAWELVRAVRERQGEAREAWARHITKTPGEILDELGRTAEEHYRALEALEKEIKRAGGNAIELARIGPLVSAAQRSAGIAGKTLEWARSCFGGGLVRSEQEDPETIDRILALHGVLGLEFRGFAFSVYANPVIAGMDGCDYEIGVFRAVLHLYREDPYCVECLWTTHPAGIPHPAGIFEQMCALRRAIANALAFGGPVSAAHYLLGAVQSTNQHNRHTVTQWRKATKKKRRRL